MTDADQRKKKQISKPAAAQIVVDPRCNIGILLLPAGVSYPDAELKGFWFLLEQLPWARVL